MTRAAEELRVSQSAVSVQIKKLDEALGHALFSSTTGPTSRIGPLR